MSTLTFVLQCIVCVLLAGAAYSSYKAMKAAERAKQLQDQWVRDHSKESQS